MLQSLYWMQYNDKGDFVMNKKFYALLVLIILIGMLVIGCADSTTTDTGNTTDNNSEVTSDTTQSLLVYSGAGLKKPMEEIKTAFEAENNVVIEYVYAGSGALLSQIETTGKGDVFIVGSQATYNTAKEKGYANEGKLVAHHTPAIIVAKGNPLNIQSLADLASDGVKVVLGDPEANAIGQTAQKLIEKNNLPGINDNVVAQTATINEIVTAITAGNADTGIVTKDSVYGNNEDIELIEIPEEENIDQLIPVCTLTMSENTELAQIFVDFVASDAGKAIFEKYGFAPVTE